VARHGILDLAPNQIELEQATRTTSINKECNLMLYLIYLEDITDNAAIRNPLLEQHMAHIGAYIERIRLAGPIMRPGGASQAGGVMLIEAESEQEVRAIIEADPYYKAGLWPEVRINAFKEIINTWSNPA
jgi:uncharacterized protein YciI